MPSTKPRIIDIGRGPQIEGHRITVMDVFYYIHRGYDFEFIHEAMPSLTREQFDAVVEYVNEHRDELVEEDRRVETFHQRGTEAQHARGGIFTETEKSLTTEERVARLKKKLEQHQAGKKRCRSS
ncbi:MAG TPA: DUF433 domain-containing protein [Gemmataceae bacterium]|nr:DUF433 domain-containing protein [Gemmataceae bacterium]